jgi:hypothetical protein
MTRGMPFSLSCNFRSRTLTLWRLIIASWPLREEIDPASAYFGLNARFLPDFVISTLPIAAKT